MGRAPCCDKQGLKKGPWTPHEDDILISYISKNGHGSWRSLPKLAGLLRCGKSCRLRWTNYLRPDIKRGPFTAEEEKLVIQLHGILGNRWAAIASQLAGRTDNEIKNLWNTHLKKRLLCLGLDPNTHEPLSAPSSGLTAMPPPSTSARHMAQWETARLEAEARHSRDPLLFAHNHNPPHLRQDADHFLRLWNSAVGDSFRNPGKPPERHSPGSQSSSSSVKYSSVSGRPPEADPGLQTGADESTGWAGTDSSGSNDLGGESAADTALQLLLDFPLGSDMSFLEEDISEYLFSCQHKSV